MPLTLEADELSEAKWWVDASIGTHCDMRIHTRGIMSLGMGAIHVSSKRQRDLYQELNKSRASGYQSHTAPNIMDMLLPRGSGLSSAATHNNLPREYKHHTVWKES